ncbi:hypothetical protein [Comamonas terrae]|uniref:Uncharacterized protein n=1 Tax=Comamonas terrae TaxID=673548 RepID=A0ABW5UQR6_9BURK|nr:hypothetical protein [Comamonas terrae]
MDQCDKDPSYKMNPRKVGFDFLSGEVMQRGFVTGAALDALGVGDGPDESSRYRAAYDKHWEVIHQVAREKLADGEDPPTVIAADLPTE